MKRVAADAHIPTPWVFEGGNYNVKKMSNMDFGIIRYKEQMTSVYV